MSKIKSYLALHKDLNAQRTLLEVAMRGVLAVLIIILLFPAMSYAKGGKTYFEVKAGQYKPTGDLTERRAHNSSDVEFSAGHRFSNYFAAEVSYGHYKVDGQLAPMVVMTNSSGLMNETGTDRIDVYPLILTLKFLYPVGDGYVYAGGGYGRYQVVDDKNLALDNNIAHFEDNFHASDTVNGWHYMIGTMLDLNKRWTLGFEFKQVKTDKAVLKDRIFGYKETYKTDVDGRMLTGFIQVRF